MMLYDAVWYCMMLYDSVWCCMILYDALWQCMMQYDGVWYCVIQYDAVWCCVVLYDAVWCCVVLYDAVWYVCYTDLTAESWDCHWSHCSCNDVTLLSLSDILLDNSCFRLVTCEQKWQYLGNQRLGISIQTRNSAASTYSNINILIGSRRAIP